MIPALTQLNLRFPGSRWCKSRTRHGWLALCTVMLSVSRLTRALSAVSLEHFGHCVSVMTGAWNPAREHRQTCTGCCGCVRPGFDEVVPVHAGYLFSEVDLAQSPSCQLLLVKSVFSQMRVTLWCSGVTQGRLSREPVRRNLSGTCAFVTHFTSL